MATMGDTPPTADVEAAEEEVVQKFRLPVDANNKATKLNILSVARPHMRAFHFAWFSFFLAFFGWFAIAPLQKKIRDHPNNAWLKVGKRFKYQNIISVAGTIFMRLVIGPFCDSYGPRLAQAILLGVFSIPLFLIGTARSYVAWTIARFFIGFIGATFVVTQFWTSVMFSGNIVGTANATSGGWGNLGGGVTQALMPLIRKGISSSRGNSFAENCALPDKCDTDDDSAWRIAVVIPGLSLVLTAAALYFLADDVPEGNYSDIKKKGGKAVNGGKSMLKAVTNWRVWILFLIYGGCFGVELIMNSNLATYFSGNGGLEPISLPEDRAGLIASLFGLMNLFARTTGGFGSDFFNKKWGIRGRLWWLFIVQFVEGIAFVCFSRAKVLGLAAPLLITFSLFVQMAEGATFGIVPFVDPEALGAISGIVGAGGNFGAVAGGFLLSDKVKYGISDGFFKLGFIVIGTACLVPLIYFPQYGGMFMKPKVVEEAEE